jgi:hypothetical protein
MRIQVGGHIGNSEIQYTEIDSEDEEKVSAYKWSLSKRKNTTYVICIKERILIHRLIMGLEAGDERVVDHLDGNGLNNRKSNLHVTSQLDNQQPWRLINTTRNHGSIFNIKRTNRKKPWRSCIYIYGIRYSAWHATEQEARDYNEHFMAMATVQADLGAT